MKFMGECTTTHSGMSEGIMWGFKADRPFNELGEIGRNGGCFSQGLF